MPSSSLSAPLVATPVRASPLRRLLPALVILPTIGLLLSGFITWVNVGFSADFVHHWMRGFLSALPVMALSFVLMGGLDRGVQRLFAGQPLVLRKIILAFVTACMMEFLLATAVTFSNVGWSSSFPAAWLAAFLKSLPLGMCIGLLMGFVVKPRIDRMLAQ
jgi:hypothetical protein